MTYVEYLKIGTSRSQTVHIGSDRNHAKSKRFTFDIAGQEKPVAFLGTVARLNQKDPECLLSLGLELRKKDTSHKQTAVQRGKEATNTSLTSPPRVANESALNDKNQL